MKKTFISLFIILSLVFSSCTKPLNNIKTFEEESTVNIYNSVNLYSYGITAYLEEVSPDYYEFKIIIHNNNTYYHTNTLCCAKLKECLEQAKSNIQDLYMLEHGWHYGCITKEEKYTAYMSDGSGNYIVECLYIENDNIYIPISNSNMFERLCAKIDYTLSLL